MTFGTVAAGISGALLLQLAWSHTGIVRALRRRDAARPGHAGGPGPMRHAGNPPLPSVTVVRPVKGTDTGQAENFRAALRTGYPGEIETIFVFEDADDQAWPLARDAVEEHERSGGHGTARILFSGPPPPTRTGKIHNMIAGVAGASGELIAFGDSDTRPDEAVLPDLVAHLIRDPTAGAAFAPPVTPTPPRTAGDVGHDIILNGFLTANMEARLGPARELPFLMGQLMLFRREALEAIGGVQCAEGQLVDDMFLGARLVEHGWRNVVGTRPVHVIVQGLAFGDFVRMWRRWLFCGRGGMPMSFVWPFVVRALGFFGSLGLAVAAVAAGPAWAVAPPATVAVLEGLHYVRLHRLLGGARIPLRLVWMVWGPYVLALPILISMLIRPELEWRGHTYRLDAAAKLRPS